MTKLSIMKQTILILLAIFTILSCSKDEVDTFDPNNFCGKVTNKSNSPNCESGLRLIITTDSGIVKSLCVSETTYNNNNIGDSFCYQCNNCN